MWYGILAMMLLLQDPAPTPAREYEDERLQQLLTVRRVYIDKLTGENWEQIRDMLIASLQNSQLFLVTENAERADAVLRGTAEDLIYTDTFQSSEGISGRGGLSASTGTGTRRRGISGNASAGDNESLRFTERRHESTASLRLVNKEGDVIWSTTQESRGAKFKSAAADVADKVAARLLEDYAKARKVKK